MVSDKCEKKNYFQQLKSDDFDDMISPVLLTNHSDI